MTQDTNTSISGEDLMAEVENLLQAAGTTNAAKPAPIEPTPTAPKPAPVVVKGYPDGTPQSVIDILDSQDKKLKTETQKVTALFKASTENAEIRKWVGSPGTLSAAPPQLKEDAAIKKALREKLGFKPGALRTTAPAAEPTPAPTVEQAAKNIEVAANVTAALVQPTPKPAPAKPAPAPVATTPKAEDISMLDALTPGAKPILRLVNKQNGKVFLLWSDVLVASHKEFQLRLRKFTAGDNSKPDKKLVPSVYLMKGEKVLSSLSPEEFIVFLNMVKQLTKSGKMDEIFQAFIALSSPG